MTTEIILHRILTVESQLSDLQSNHEQMTRYFQGKVIENQQRYAHLQGRLAELKELQQHEHTTDTGANGGGPCPSAPGIPYPDRGLGRYLGTDVVDRTVDPPNPEPGKTGSGDCPPHFGRPMGGPEFLGP